MAKSKGTSNLGGSVPKVPMKGGGGGAQGRLDKIKAYGGKSKAKGGK
jgi:hypothetical protein